MRVHGTFREEYVWISSVRYFPRPGLALFMDRLGALFWHSQYIVYGVAFHLDGDC